MQRVFEALSSPVRRSILVYLAHAELNAGDIASRFAMSKPSISQHLSILEAAGLVASERRGQFVWYRLVPDSLVNTLHGFVQEVCPVARPLKRESAALAQRADATAPDRTTAVTVTDHLHIVTGGPGSGKSTLVAALAAAGIATSEEVGRRVIREQFAAGGDALPWGDRQAFAASMLAGERDAHAAALARGGPVVLDRGLPDVVGFLRTSDLPVPPDAEAAARTVRYNPRVFVAPFWPEIYTRDPERRQSPDVAAATEAIMRETYAGYGYTLVELPRASVAARVAFVMECL